jgi:hypothetical protein
MPMLVPLNARLLIYGFVFGTPIKDKTKTLGRRNHPRVTIHRAPYPRAPLDQPQPVQPHDPHLSTKLQHQRPSKRKEQKEGHHTADKLLVNPSSPTASTAQPDEDEDDGQAFFFSDLLK